MGVYEFGGKQYSVEPMDMEHQTTSEDKIQRPHKITPVNIRGTFKLFTSYLLKTHSTYWDGHYCI